MRQDTGGLGTWFKFLFESCREFKSLSIRITVFSNTQITWTILMSWGLLPYTRDSAILIKKLRISYRMVFIYFARQLVKKNRTIPWNKHLQNRRSSWLRRSHWARPNRSTLSPHRLLVILSVVLIGLILLKRSIQKKIFPFINSYPGRNEGSR